MFLNIYRKDIKSVTGVYKQFVPYFKKGLYRKIIAAVCCFIESNLVRKIIDYRK